MPAVSQPLTARIRGNLFCCVLTITCLFLVGCGGNVPQPQNEKTVTPVSGVVTLDGEPTLGIEVILNEAGGMDMSNPSISRGRTDEAGRFSITTYRTNDGAPPGDYTVTFKYFGPMVVGADLIDRFGGAYMDPGNSEFKVTVPAEVPEGSESFDLGELALTSP